MRDWADDTSPTDSRGVGAAGRRPPGRRDRSSGPGRQPVTLLPARTVPLDADTRSRAVAAIGALLAAYFRSHPTASPHETGRGHQQDGPDRP